MTNIVTEFGRFRYNHLPMVIFDSVYILQTKVYKLLGDIECVKAYINDILVLIEEVFSNHIYQIRVIFAKLSSI